MNAYFGHILSLLPILKPVIHCCMKTLLNKKYALQFSALFLVCLLNFCEVSGQSTVTTFAGDGLSGLINGDTANCRFKSPDGICRDQSGNLFIADGDNHCIRKISPDGLVTTYAGTGLAGYVDGPAATAQFRTPFDVCVDVEGNVYVSDFENQYIRRIDTDGTVSTVAGNGIAGYVDGSSATAQFNYPRGIVIDATGNLYVSDSWNHRVRKIDASGEVSTYAGGGSIFGVQSVSEFKDGSDTSARFYTPCGLSIDDIGNIYVADAYNHRVRKIDLSQYVSTVAGTGISGAAGGGFVDGDISVARFNTLTELFVSGTGTIYVSDTYNNRIRKIENGIVSTLAGSGVAGYLDGPDSLAKFNHPRGVVLDGSAHSILVCDGNNRRIRRVTIEAPTGIESLSASLGQAVFPNPSNGLFYFHDVGLHSNIKVSDITGRLVTAIDVVKEGQFALDLAGQQAGMYLVTVTDKAGVVLCFKIYKTP